MAPNPLLEPPRTRSTTSSNSGATAVTPLATDAAHPRIPYIRINGTKFKHAELSEQHHNWDSWSRHIGYVLAMSGDADDILNGTLARPDPDYEPISYRNWGKLDGAIRALCLKNMTLAEVSFVEDGAFSTSHDMWDALRAHHTKLGPMVQVLDMRSILNMRFGQDPATLMSYADKIIRRSHAFYKMGIPSADMFCVLYLVNALEDPIYTQAKERIICDIQSSTVDKPYTTASFLTALRGIKTALESGQFSAGPLLANTARTATVTNISNCTNVPNCKTPKTHTLPYCTAPGGGMAGKTVAEAQAQRRIDRGLPPQPKTKSNKTSQRSSASSSKPKKVYRDHTGRAYIVDMDSDRITSLSEDNDSVTDAPAGLFTSVPSDDVSTILAHIDGDVRESMTEADLSEYVSLNATAFTPELAALNCLDYTGSHTVVSQANYF
ncbi:hypothetical protein FISHEDRAFT_72693 [Fistulina hepatica ATCC 64428]|nr:hypothetical protein FISHEDRAFT_72693 [Fistulina hepatica ATCC 64428]